MLAAGAASSHGQLEHVTRIIKGGRAFLRRLHWAKRGGQRASRVIALREEHREDLRCWGFFLRNYNARALLKFIPKGEPCEAKMCSDASLRGFGGHLGSTVITGRFPESWCRVNIQALELYPIVAMFGMFKEELRNKVVQVVCDNLPLVHNLNFLSSANGQVMALLRPLVLLLLECNISLEAVHISTRDNWVCDRLSRRQVSAGWLRNQGLDPEPTRIPRQWRPESWRMPSTDRC